MFKQTLIISTIVALLSVTGSAKGGHGNGNQRVNQTTQVTALSDTQKAGLVFMIEEEKVARDVYLHLYAKWGTAVFKNIAKSEQKHMDAVKGLLTKYGLYVPATLTTQGDFENSELKALYEMLIAKGDSSLIDALEVGMMVEETDIDDLKALLSETMPSDIKRIYSNLLRGSYNHLSSFNKVLSLQ